MKWMKENPATDIHLEATEVGPGLLFVLLVFLIAGWCSVEDRRAQLAAQTMPGNPVLTVTIGWKQ